MRRKLSLMLVLSFGLMFCFTRASLAEESMNLTIKPAALNIGTFFAGSEIHISGELAADQDVIVEIAGPAVNGKFNVKGRVGPFWMTRDHVELDNAPGMYILLLPQGPDWQDKASGLGLGLAHIKSRLAIQPGRLAVDDVFDMFLDLKKSEDLYREQNDAISYSSDQNGHRRFSAVFMFPRSTAAGQYTIKATALSMGHTETIQTRRFQVEEVGFTRVIDDLATQQRLLYGVMAVLIALFTGALMGLVFKGGGSH